MTPPLPRESAALGSDDMARQWAIEQLIIGFEKLARVMNEIEIEKAGK